MIDKDLAKFDSLCTKLLPKNYKEKSGQIKTTIYNTSLALHYGHSKENKIQN